MTLKHLLALCGLFALSFTSAQNQPATPFDEPVQQQITDANVILTLIGAAQKHIFLITPAITSPTLTDALADRLSEGVVLYVILGDTGITAQSERLRAAGAQIRHMPNLGKSLLLVDYRNLVVGPLVAGQRGPGDTLLIDTSYYGNAIVQQLRAVWQTAGRLQQQGGAQ